MRGKIIAGLIALALAMPATSQVSYGNDGEKFLFHLKEGDNAEALELAERHGASVVNFRGTDGDSSIHVVTRARSEKWLSYLLSKGGDPNLAGRDGDTPLQIAASIGHISGATLLLRRGAKINKPNKQGTTPLIAAVHGRQTNMIAFLLRNGADPDQQDYVTGHSARDYAKRDNRVPAMARMMEGVTVEKTDAD